MELRLACVECGASLDSDGECTQECDHVNSRPPAELLYGLVRRPYVGDTRWVYVAVCCVCEGVCEGDNPYQAMVKGGGTDARKAVEAHLMGKHRIDLR